MRITKEEWMEHQRREQENTRRSEAQGHAARALEKHLRRPATEQDKALAKSIAGQVMGENPANNRPKLKEPPKNLRWGGIISTNRDEEHCSCGLLPSEHIPANMAGISCPRMQPATKEKK